MIVKNELPLVSICTITYNHESFIREALESFLNQKTNFKYEIIIYDDASTDNTQKIIREIEIKYPYIIKPHYQTVNQYSKGVRGIAAKFTFPRAQGKYIAMCEGDDYWIDPYKLQKQVDFLENNPTISMTFGNALIDDSTYQYHRKGKYLNSDIAKVYNVDSVFELGLPTLTMVFRNGLFNFSGSKAMSGDLFLRLELSLFGGFYYHGEVFGVHRKHPTGISRTNNRLLWNINTAENLIIFEKKALKSQRNNLSKKIVKHWIHAFVWSLLLKKYSQSVSIFINILFSKAFYSRLGFGTFKMLIVNVFLKKDESVLDIF